MEINYNCLKYTFLESLTIVSFLYLFLAEQHKRCDRLRIELRFQSQLSSFRLDQLSLLFGFHVELHASLRMQCFVAFGRFDEEQFALWHFGIGAQRRAKHVESGGLTWLLERLFVESGIAEELGDRSDVAQLL